MKKILCFACTLVLYSAPLNFNYLISLAKADECAPEEPDGDNDGLCDRLDGCPSDQFRLSPGVCGCGTNPDGESDNDNDQVVNCLDVCPDNSTKTSNAGVCGCGYESPEPDYDQDSFPDCSEQVNNPNADQCPYDPEKRLPGVCGCGNEENVALCTDHCEEDVTSENILSKVTRTSRNVRVNFKMRPGFDTSCLVPEDPETDEKYEVYAKINSRKRGAITVGPVTFTGNQNISVSFNSIKMTKRDRMEFFVKKIEPESGGEDEEFNEATCRATSTRKVSCESNNQAINIQ